VGALLKGTNLYNFTIYAITDKLPNVDVIGFINQPLTKNAILARDNQHRGHMHHFYMTNIIEKVLLENDERLRQ